MQGHHGCLREAVDPRTSDERLAVDMLANPREMRGVRFIRSVVYLRRRWPVELAIGAIFRNEARYLAEWLEFHQRQGVERFYLYENHSTDDWKSALAPFADVVDVQRWSDHPGQLSAYADCVRRHRWDTRWIAFIDLDEFLFSPTGRSLPDVLREFPRVPAVVANWRCYGTSGYAEPPDAPVVESYIWRARDDHPLNQVVKSIVFPAMTQPLVETPHVFRLYGRMVGERGDTVRSPFRRDPPTADLIRINHYGTRSLVDLHQKLTGPRADSPGSRTVVDAESLTADLKALNAVRDPLHMP